jgi:hypothetical protein
MADKRTEDFPLGSWEKGQFDYFLWNAFFDDDVQRILRTRKELNYREPKFPKAGTNSLLLSWPIKAYRDLAYLVYDAPKYWEEPWFPTFYHWDPEFISKLLVAMTSYKNLPPNKWDLTRAVVECPREESLPSKRSQIEELLKPGTIIPPDELQETIRMLDFVELEKIINDAFPHLKSTSTRPDNLRTGVFYKERKNRREILKDWAENFSSDERVSIPEDLSTMPCRPDADYYKIPVEKSVSKKPQKK